MAASAGTAAKKPAAKKPAAKKPAAKKAASIRLSAEEKKLIQHYRKCNMVEQKLILTAVEKMSEGSAIETLTSLLKK
jgi:hypothetical protein